MTAILLATDLSPYGDRALDRAAMLAAERGASLTLVHVVSRDLMSGERHAAAVAAAERSLREYAEDAALPDGLALATLARGGEAGPEIAQAARETGSELVVMAAPHADLLVQLFRSSVLNHVVRHAPCPVLVVRGRARRGWRRVLVAVDLSQPSRLALETALRLRPDAEMAEMALTVVHAHSAGAVGMAAEEKTRVDDMLSASLARLAAEGRTAPGSVTIVSEPGKPEAVVPAVAARVRAELAVVGTLGLTGAANLLLGSTAEALLASLGCDVLAVRPKEG